LAASSIESSFTETENMNRSLIASFAALSMVAAPALAATTTTAPAKVAKHQKPSKLAGAKVTKAAAKTTKSK
jgi:hypothetical protein